MSTAVGEKKEFNYSASDFEAVRSKLKSIAGINLVDSKDSMVYSRLARRIRKLNLSNFTEYLNYVDKHAEEHEEFVNALTTNLTSFFREKHHFEFLKTYLQEKNGPVKIWCSASSTGEEPYSIAMTAVNAFNSFKNPVSIVASDIDSNVLDTASKGVYQLKNLDDLQASVKKRFFQRGTGSNSGLARVVPELRKMIDFRKLNLMDNQFDLSTDFDVVFCRNVMIYFDKKTQADILRKILRHVKRDGVYIAGHSENFSHVAELLAPQGQTIYKIKGR
ncbi:MAG: CheR family methyltransferase [Pseudomonadota bacterium]